MTRNHRTKAGLLLLAAMLATGCASAVKAPVVNLASVRVAGLGLRGASLIAELDIENDNDFDIEADSITYQLFANTSSSGENWQSILQRSYTQRIVIAEEKTTRVDIPIEFNYSDLSGAARTILDRGMLNYRIQGQAFVREPLRRTIPFTKTGNVSLAGAR